MRPSRLESAPQRRPRAEQMRLTHILVERLGTKPVGQRPIRPLAAGGHCVSRPMTSTPAGGVKENRSGAKLALRELCENVN